MILTLTIFLVAASEPILAFDPLIVVPIDPKAYNATN